MHIYFVAPFIFVLCIVCLLVVILSCLDCEEDQGTCCDCGDCAGFSEQGKWHSSNPILLYALDFLKRVECMIGVLF